MYDRFSNQEATKMLYLACASPEGTIFQRFIENQMA